MEKQENDKRLGERSNSLSTESKSSEDDIEYLEKKLSKQKKEDDKAFMDMLRTTSRNHYTLNQMVDRKARILLSVNALILSLIISVVVTHNSFPIWEFGILLIFGIFCFISIIYSMFAVNPEKSHGKSETENLRDNPLFFGNFKNVSEKEYIETMMGLSDNRDLIFKSMIRDLYHLGLILENKRQYLRSSLNYFIIGLSISLIFSFAFHVFNG